MSLPYDSKMNEKELIKYAASIETYSEHPIAKGIVDFAENTFSVEGFKAAPDKGAQGKINGKDVKVVSPGYLEENSIKFEDDKLKKLTSQGKTVVFVLIDNELAGAVALADIIKQESVKTISRLKEMDIMCMMITGDNKQVANWVEEEIGLDEYFAGVLPDKKAEMVKEVQSRGMLVVMTGDGVINAPALAQANIGIAIGASTDVAASTADIILVRSNHMDVVSIIGLSLETYRKMVQNLVWATGYNIYAISISAGALYSFGILLSPQ